MNKLSILSFLFSIAGIILIVSGQYYLGIAYDLADGKTQALYGLKSLSQLKLSGIGLFALLISIMNIRKEKTVIVLITLVFALISMVLPFTNLWEIWV